MNINKKKINDIGVLDKLISIYKVENVRNNLGSYVEEKLYLCDLWGSKNETKKTFLDSENRPTILTNITFLFRYDNIFKDNEASKLVFKLENNFYYGLDYTELNKNYISVTISSYERINNK